MSQVEEGLGQKKRLKRIGMNVFSHRGDPRIGSLDVHRQYSLNCCWAVAGAECMGMVYALINDDAPYVELSSQQLLDQVPIVNKDAFRNREKDGEGIPQAKPRELISYLEDGGICEALYYPFERRREKDEDIEAKNKLAAVPPRRYKVSSHHSWQKDRRNTNTIIRALFDLPLLAFLRVDSKFCRLQKGEIYDWEGTVNEEDRIYNHVVIITGYGKQGGSLFYEVKNNWGRGWADNGYGWISMNSTCVDRVVIFKDVQKVD